MLAGGTEAPICAADAGELRDPRSRPELFQRASRPFDAGRDGFVLGEARQRCSFAGSSPACCATGARIYAEIIGYASTCDTYHVTAPHPEGDGAAHNGDPAGHWRGPGSTRSRSTISARTPQHAGRRCVRDTGDQARVRRYANSVPISSTKSMIGHLTSAAGAVEATATIWRSSTA